MDKNNLTKEYSNGEITIVWQSGKCIHSGNCVKNLPAVFQPKEQPWIKIANATTVEIVATVAKCPSGALSIKAKNRQP
jgi:uncharacterized Fe-S cluster protein YjdI